MAQRSPLSTDDFVGILFGAAAFRFLHAGHRLGLFELLRTRPGATADEVGEALGLRPRATRALLLGTTALRLTERVAGGYGNSALVGAWQADGTWSVVGDLVDFEADLVYEPLAELAESIRTDSNAGLRRLPGHGDDLYRRVASDPGLEELFYRCMRSWSRLSNPVLVAGADLTGVRRVLDAGGGDGVNAIALARAHPDIELTVLDLPGALRIARDRIAEAGLSDRIRTTEGDLFAAEYPGGHDCVLFANQFVIWSPEQNLGLLRRARAALPPGGKVVVFNAFTDDEGDGPLYAALDNAYFTALPAGEGALYPWHRYEEWLQEAGFTDVRRHRGGTWTPHGVVSGVRR